MPLKSGRDHFHIIFSSSFIHRGLVNVLSCCTCQPVRLHALEASTLEARLWVPPCDWQQRSGLRMRVERKNMKFKHCRNIDTAPLIEEETPTSKIRADLGETKKKVLVMDL
jgi:hypothetical protein